MIAEILKREAIAGEGSAGHLLSFFLVDILFSFFNQRKNVAHAEDAGHDAIGMERLERVILFAHADELDGLACDLADGERRAAARVAIHFG